MKINIVLPLVMVTLISVTLSTSFVKNAHSEYLAVDRSDKAREIDILKISIGRLMLGIKSKEVIKILGQPQQRQQIENVCTERGTRLKYNNLEVFLADSRDAASNPIQILFTISTTNPSYATSEGVRVGDPIGKAKKAYAQYKSTLNSQLLTYPANLGESSLSFKVNKGLITEIILDEGC
jgi:hypothetical protein